MPPDRQPGLFRKFFSWLGQHELGFLLSIAALVAGLWIFAIIAEEVMEGDTAYIDRKILLAMRNPNDLADPLGPPSIEEAARDITALGGVTILTLLTLSVGAYFILDAKRRLALFVWVSVFAGMLVSSALKYMFARPRPDLVPHAMYVVHSSFPSGHSMLSAVTYLTLGALLARGASRRRIKAYFMLIATVLTLAVGVTRVYLGVHWPTDVLAGWTAGACWSLLCWTGARYLQRRWAIEPATSTGDLPVTEPTTPLSKSPR